MAGISIRKSIRWLPHEPSEPTSTIVLSSPERRFVDIRILRFNDGKAVHDTEVSPSQHLDWGIAGTSFSVEKPERGQNVKLTTFRHWIDSRTVDVDSATDEGFMYPQGVDGQDELVLEIGNMINPDTGLPADYEEIWIERELEPVPGDAGSQMLVLDFDQGNDYRGRVVRVGKLCQGLLRMKDKIIAERWEWNEEEEWRRSKLIGGDGMLPCKELFHSSIRSTIEHSGRIWTIVERS